MEINSDIIFEQFFKIQQNALDSLNFPEINKLTRADLHSIASDIYQQIIENIGD